jgi:hypothetical protein
MKTIVLLVVACLLASIAGVAAADAQTIAAESAAHRTVARRIPIGATVLVTTCDGERLKAVLFGVDDDGITVKPATRLPVAARWIPFDRLDAIERHEGRLHFGRYVGAGAAIGGGLLLVLLLGFAGG